MAMYDHHRDMIMDIMDKQEKYNLKMKLSERENQKKKLIQKKKQRKSRRLNRVNDIVEKVATPVVDDFVQPVSDDTPKKTYIVSFDILIKKLIKGVDSVKRYKRDFVIVQATTFREARKLAVQMVEDRRNIKNLMVGEIDQDLADLYSKLKSNKKSRKFDWESKAANILLEMGIKPPSENTKIIDNLVGEIEESLETSENDPDENN